MEQSSNTKTFLLLGLLFIITIGSALLPASWFGVNVKKDNPSLDLTSVNKINITPKSADGAPLTWKSLADKTFADQPELLAKIKSTPPDEKIVTQLNDSENLTASFSKNLYVASAYIKENNITDEATQQDIIDQLTQQEAAKISPTKYLYKDLNVAKTESKESIKTYGNAVAAILNDLITEKSVTDDFYGITEYLQSKDESSLASINSDYQNVNLKLKKLLALPVPPSFSAAHIIMLNQVALYKDNLYNLSKINTDALRAKLSMENFTNVAAETVLMYGDLAKYFNLKNIVFSSNEPGYMFTVGYTIK